MLLINKIQLINKARNKLTINKYNKIIIIK